MVKKAEVSKKNTMYAGFFMRYFARLADCFIYLFFSFLFLIIANLSNKDLRGIILTFGWYIILNLIASLLLPYLYLSWLTYKYGGTPGKLIGGMEVVDENGKHLTFGKSLFRHYIGYAVSLLFFGLGFFWVIKDPKKQGWHDQMTGSYVVRKRNSQNLLVLFTLAVFIIDCLMIFVLVQQVIYNQVLRGDFEKIRQISGQKKPIPDNSNPFFNELQEEQTEEENNFVLPDNQYQYDQDDFLTPYPQL